ncbi:MAG TPA: transposase [Planctomycetota bacterium]|nr:transposase [Planctomycetota bacterium]
MKRIHLDKASWHVIMRGVRRLMLFRDDADRAAYIRILDRALKRHPVALHAFVLMDNHTHLLLSGSWDALGALMHDLNRLYSRGNNQKYEQKGHAYEGPYKAFPQGTKFWMGRTARYIDFNPVKAGMVGRPEDYPWSSCRTYVRGDASPLPLDTKPVLDAFGGREKYRSFVPPSHSKKVGRDITAMDVWMEQVAWILQWAEEHSSELEGEDPNTVAVAWARQAGIPPRAIAKALGYASGHSVSVLLDSLRKRSEKEPHLQKIMRDSGI